MMLFDSLSKGSTFSGHPVKNLSFSMNHMVSLSLEI